MTNTANVQFNFQDWNIGPYNSQIPSSVVLQIFSDCQDIQSLTEEISKLALENNISFEIE